MRVLVLSDLHLEIADLQLPPSATCDVAVLAGDICCPGSAVPAWVRATPVLQRAKAVVVVSGNHEYFDSVMQHEAQAMQSAARDASSPAIHLLDGAQVVVDGVRFLGCTLWTDFALHIDTPAGPSSDRERGIEVARRVMVDYRSIGWRDAAGLRRLDPQDTLRLHVEQRDWLEQALAEAFDGPTVVVTHHGPHRDSLAPRFAADWVSTAYLSELPAHFFDVPVLWVHGHTHSSHDHHVGGCRVLCNPRGYQAPGAATPENAAFDPALVLQLEV